MMIVDSGGGELARHPVSPTREMGAVNPPEAATGRSTAMRGS